MEPVRQPAAGHRRGATTHPSNASANNRHTNQYFGIYTQVLSNNTVNEIKGGLASNYYTLEPLAGWGTVPPVVRQTPRRFSRA